MKVYIFYQYISTDVMLVEALIHINIMKKKFKN